MEAHENNPSPQSVLSSHPNTLHSNTMPIRKTNADCGFPCSSIHNKDGQCDVFLQQGVMYFLYKALQRATGAKLCCKARFCNETEENIITCSSDTMIVYRVVRTSKSSDPNESSTDGGSSLQVVCEYPFSGEILSIAPIPLRIVFSCSPTERRDAIIMSFKGYYVSIVAFDSQNDELYNVECYDFHKESVVALDSRDSRLCEE